MEIVEDEEGLAYVRLNILLAEDALRKLDAMKNRAGLSSRGRTIQELIDTVWELQPDVNYIIEEAKNPSDFEYYLKKIMPFLVNILRCLSRFQK